MNLSKYRTDRLMNRHAIMNALPNHDGMPSRNDNEQLVKSENERTRKRRKSGSGSGLVAGMAEQPETQRS